MAQWPLAKAMWCTLGRLRSTGSAAAAAVTQLRADDHAIAAGLRGVARGRGVMGRGARAFGAAAAMDDRAMVGGRAAEGAAAWGGGAVGGDG